MNSYVIVGSLFCLLVSLYGVEGGESLLESLEDTAEQVALAAECAALSTSCEDCTSNAKCLWCSSKIIQCIPYPAEKVIPPKEVCDLGDARWGVCWVNYLILLIVMGCIAGLIIISVILCIWCCCCRGK